MGLLQKDILNGIEDVDVKSSTYIIKGYASIFGNVDSDNDIIEKGAYRKTIQEWGPQGKNRIKLCWQHDITDPIGKTTELYEDSKGLAFVSELPHDGGIIDSRIALVKNGVIDELSVGIIPIKTNKDNTGVRRITENKLFEYSLVTLASNDMAKLMQSKGMNNSDIIAEMDKKSQSIIKMLREGSMTDEAFHMLEYYHNQMIKQITDLAKPSNDTSFEPLHNTQSETIEIKELIKNTFKNLYVNN